MGKCQPDNQTCPNSRTNRSGFNVQLLLSLTDDVAGPKKNQKMSLGTFLQDESTIENCLA